MKKLILCALMLLALLAQPVMADFSAVKTADSAAVTGAGTLAGIVFVTDGTNSVTVNVYDNASAASGTKLIPTDYLVTTSSSNRVHAIGFDKGEVPFHKGVYVDVTTSGTVAYIVYYNTIR